MNDLNFKKYQVFQGILVGYAILFKNSDWPPKQEVLKSMQINLYVPIKGSNLLQMFLKILSAECLWTYYV